MELVLPPAQLGIGFLELGCALGNPDLQLVAGFHERLLTLLLRRTYPACYQCANDKCGEICLCGRVDGEGIQRRHKEIINSEGRNQHREESRAHAAKPRARHHGAKKQE